VVPRSVDKSPETPPAPQFQLTSSFPTYVLLRKHGVAACSAFYLCKGAFHDFSSATLHRGHADPEFGREHPVLLGPIGIKIRTPLQQISIVGTGADSDLSGVLNQRKEVGPGFDPRHHFRAALPL
jgi:hypothetical protein